MGDEVSGVHTLLKLQVEPEAFRAKFSIHSATNTGQYFSTSWVNSILTSEHWWGWNFGLFNQLWNIIEHHDYIY